MKRADKIILAQPYSPHLFRQGLLPGPKLLLDLLLRKVSYAQVKKQWSEVEKEKQENKSSKKYEVANMELPCRRCTDNNDNKEVCKPLTQFITNKNLDSLDRDVLRKGQDLVCIKCRHGLRWTNYDDVIFCSMCGFFA